MKKIDKYIIKKFLGTFFFALGLIICIAIIFDISEKMDDFLDKNAPFKAIIFEYYFNFIPYFANMFSPLFVFISVIFFTSRMASKSEFIAMYSSGISLRRLLFPYFIAATIITSFSFILGNYIIPDSNKKLLQFQSQYLKNNHIKYSGFNTHRQIYPGVYFYAESYNNSQNIGIKISLEKFEGEKLVSKLFAESMLWDSINNKWILQNYYIRDYKEFGETIKEGIRLDTAFRISPHDFVTKLDEITAMNVSELNAYIAEQKLSGTSAIISSEIEKHSRIANPFATFILTIVGFSLSVRKVRGGIGLNLGIGTLISFAYILFMRFTAVFAINGYLTAGLSVWVPNILFSIIAISIYLTTPK